jgi:hypothetical protein
MAMDMDATTEKQLEAVFSMVHTLTVTMKQRGKHASTTIEDLFSTWSMPKGYQQNKFRAA